jgi:hypothetical protein
MSVSLRKNILDWARWDMAHQNSYTPTKSELNNYFIESGANSKGNDGRPWCGIWATFILRKAGMNVKWGPLNKHGWGIVDLSGGFITLRGGSAGIRPGDVAVIPALNHHFFIEDVVEEYDYLQTLDGNQEYGSIRRRYDRSLSDLQFYYRIGN